nr:DUF1540 domain-containing protein [uncultured Cellulosilyticum sp.]
MPNLRCDVKNCSYNEEYHCCLSQIKVGDQVSSNPDATNCESFVESEYVASNCSMGPKEEVDVNCSAIECVFNCNHECLAVDVEISGATTACHLEDTCCNTFISK